nr:MAG TPA_asm: hypothetical protein [Caudoviricetes sp.]
MISDKPKKDILRLKVVKLYRGYGKIITEG